jgi:hypothetical protein
MMDLTRNQFFLIGFVALLLGIEFRMVETFELSAESSQILFKQGAPPLAAMNSTAAAFGGSSAPAIKKSFRPPDWIGWSLLSTGAVLILHSWAMKKDGG